MKTFLLSIISLFIVSIAAAQVPPAFNYQAVARNNAGVALANQTMQVRLSVRQGSTTLYSETRTVTTNLLGLFNVQIGSVGATSTTGSISAINWGNSNAGWYSLKVELDLSNNNVFTDMGTQALTSVPFALAAEKANATNSVSGFPLDTQTTPKIGTKLIWNGSEWKPSNTLDTTIMVSGTIGGIPPSPSGSLPWVEVSGSSAIITVTGNETIIATYDGSFNNPAATSFKVSFHPLYQLLPAGPLTPFSNNFLDASLSTDGTLTALSTSAAIKLPAGTYKICMGIKNKSTTVSLSPNDKVNGVIQVR